MPYSIVVLIKQIPDIDQLRTDPNTGEPQMQNLPLRTENLSKNAIEAAVQIKEKYGGKVTGIIFGREQSTASMKEAYAMGVDDGIIVTGYQRSEPSVTARVLAEKIKQVPPHDLIILGNQSADSYTGMLPGRLSRILGIPLVGNAVKIECSSDQVKVTRATEEGNMVVQGKVPLIISVAQEINTPRLPAVLQIMAAGGRKPIRTEAAQNLSYPDVRVISNRAPKSERKRIIYEDMGKAVPEIVKVIKEAMR
ncbi:electron transfer flavoprotein subunit beta/FixA family protein [Thermogymnomonas acidicola]|uniref:electron transfer flavoprotein subunit beta/FixA family protein n=1 Tax=Thermogymnomonas acidicola TaxID=399579 RepID=UPI0009464401|nr:electron transfer flavoprotein subunit beta/FixA family protein [Thermogymnomonas acidicola]